MRWMSMILTLGIAITISGCRHIVVTGDDIQRVVCESFYPIDVVRFSRLQDSEETVTQVIKTNTQITGHNAALSAFDC